MRAVAVLPVCFSLLASCTNPEPKTAKKSDEVPVNSRDDAKLQEASKQEEPKDPTQPLTQKVGEPAPDLTPPPSCGSSPCNASGNGSGKPNPNAATKAECDKAMDKYLSLEIASNPQLKGVPPDVIEQAKQMAREQHGEAPCTATKAQYKCAMGASTVAAWQKCMK